MARLVQLGDSPKMKTLVNCSCQDLACEKAQMSETMKEYMDITLDDLEVVATLGVGGFGRVELVKVINLA